MTNHPIGIFDSGVGGISVWKEVQSLLPHEDIIYFADNINCPYGNKSSGEVIELSKSAVDFLLSKNCKIIVVACNTATAGAIDFLRKNYDIPFIGMEPAVKPAAINSKTGKFGVLATRGTFEGRLFKETSEKYAHDKDMIICIGNGLVEIVEAGSQDSDEAVNLLQGYIKPMMEQGIDYLVLGCTHYPFLSDSINKITGGKIKLIDPAPAVARRTKDILEKLELEPGSKTPEYKFYASGEISILKKIVNKISGNIKGNFIFLPY